MIYCSTACIKENNLILNVKKILDLGYRNIELTGGCIYSESIESKLLSLKREYDINFLIHNYFPPPKKNFIINTSDKIIEKKLKNFLIKTIDLCKLLGSPNFGIHAGFLISINNFKSIDNSKNILFFDKVEAIKNMADIVEYLSYLADDEVTIFIENNVISKNNYHKFNSRNPFLLTSVDDYKQINKFIKFNLLLDLAHLKVSCKTLGLDYFKEAEYLTNLANYIHISGNNGYEDNNQSLKNDQETTLFLKKFPHLFKKKKITLEIYSGYDDIEYSHNLLKTTIK